MSKERTVITQELCRKVQIMLNGAKANEVAALLGIGTTTIHRIRMAGFSAEQYRRNVEARREDKEKPEEPKPAEEQLAGQICMELPEKEKPEAADQGKMIRFMAGRFAELDRRMETLTVLVDRLILAQSKMNDYLGQIIRILRKE